jgi:hypothetical protein
MILRPLSLLPRRIPPKGLPLLLLGLLGCSGGPPGPRRLDLQLTVAAKDPLTRQQMQRGDGRYTSIRFAERGQNCRGGAGFAAFQAATPVEVQDQSGRVLGDGTLGDGTFEIKGRDPEGETLYTACRFRVAIPLAAEARIYIVRIGGEALVRRLHVSEMHRLKGTVRLTID